ncbi:MAG: ABC transporter substrate-binding protein [Candidatus Micropelagos sp.]|nr:ABC transporter substrate-binding protein [Candidatus Micropelagos sp.]
MFNRIIILCSVFFLSLTPVVAEKSPEAEAFVMDVSNQVIEILNLTTAQEKEDEFRVLLNNKANLKRIAAFTLGKYRRQISPTELQEFQSLFETMITKVYANRLGSYEDQKIVVLGSEKKKKDYLVETELRFNDGSDPIAIVWRLRQEKDGRITLFDLRVLGIWMALEQRETFLSILKNNNEDFNVLLDNLRQQISAGSTVTSD